MAIQDREWGLVAILDALGAASYSDQEIARFLKSRENVLALLNAKAEAVLGEIKKERLSTFTFNDTILILYRTEREATTRDVQRFFTLLRKFIVDSLVNQVLFRGAIAVGSFYVNDDTNTVMGSAVTDAAAWYDRAEWIGVHATPHASITIDALPDSRSQNMNDVIVDYDIPIKDATALRLKAVNWPKAFFVPSLSPCGANDDPACTLRGLLVKHRVPKGTEHKYLNTIAFFDHVASAVAKGKSAAARKRAK